MIELQPSLDCVCKMEKSSGLDRVAVGNTGLHGQKGRLGCDQGSSSITITQFSSKFDK